jgi:hypothetical protein
LSFPEECKPFQIYLKERIRKQHHHPKHNHHPPFPCNPPPNPFLHPIIHPPPTSKPSSSTFLKEAHSTKAILTILRISVRPTRITPGEKALRLDSTEDQKPRCAMQLIQCGQGDSVSSLGPDKVSMEKKREKGRGGAEGGGFI